MFDLDFLCLNKMKARNALAHRVAAIGTMHKSHMMNLSMLLPHYTKLKLKITQKLHYFNLIKMEI